MNTVTGTDGATIAYEDWGSRTDRPDAGPSDARRAGRGA
jgi:hypothetical protein